MSNNWNLKDRGIGAPVNGKTIHFFNLWTTKSFLFQLKGENRDLVITRETNPFCFCTTEFLYYSALHFRIPLIIGDVMLNN